MQRAGDRMICGAQCRNVVTCGYHWISKQCFSPLWADHTNLILNNFIQINSHASHTPLSITNFGRGHASLGPLSNLQVVTQALNCLKNEKKGKKDKNFGSNAEIFEVSRKNSAAAEMSNR
jgi:hypothetical protein